VKKTLYDKIKMGVKTSQMANENHVKLKLILQEFVAKHGSHRNILDNAVELIHNMFGACKEAYHGGDYNGMCAAK
jgi:hypothetical protein